MSKVLIDYLIINIYEAFYFRTHNKDYFTYEKIYIYMYIYYNTFYIYME